VSSFGKKYSRYYDILYSDKDYNAECDYLQSLFKELSTRRVRKIIDVACGTGGHSVPLAQRGYKILARDLSADMLEVARSKVSVSGLGSRVSLEKGDMRNLKDLGRFDVCLCMFASIGYLSSLEEILKTLEAMRSHLNTGGLLIFDFWNGLAVLTVKPSRRAKTAYGKGLTITRAATPLLDPVHNLCRVRYDISVMDGSRRIDEFSEVHSMRYFYPEEIRLLLRLSSFELVSFHPFLERRRSVGMRDWNVTAVARAVK